MANRKIEPRLLPETHEYLQDLVETGTYGTNPTDVARALIDEGIRRAIPGKLIVAKRRSKPRSPTDQTGHAEDL
jgi:hypothetical protein